MASFNLIRNSRVFFTSNVDQSTGVVANSLFTTSNSQELSVLDGFTFSQSTNAETVSINEAGTTPVRGTRSFNTALNPVEFSFSTYFRPYLSTTVKADESVLWNALFSDKTIGASGTSISFVYAGALTPTYTSATGVMSLSAVTSITVTGLAVGDIVTWSGLTGANASLFNTPVLVTGITATQLTVQYLVAPQAAAPTIPASGTATLSKVAWTEHTAVAADTIVGNVPYSAITAAMSNLNQLQKFGLVITVDGVTYAIDNCVLSQASIDFGLDGIAMISWSGNGAELRQLANNVTYTASGNDWTLGGGTLSGTIKGRSAQASTRLITNKLSTISIKQGIGGSGANTYSLALTGGNITINNNVQYVTPATLGIVNKPIGYFTGGRTISGNVSAYLRTGSLNSAGLLAQALTESQTSAELKYQITLTIGGSTNANKIEFLVPGASLQVPTVDAQQVMSTTINFTAQATDYVQSSTASYDLENTNEIRVRYFSS